MLARAIDNTSGYNLDNGNMPREVMVKIGLEGIDMQEEVTMEALLDSGATGLVNEFRICKEAGCYKLKTLRLVKRKNLV